MTKQLIRELPSPPDQTEGQEGNLSRQEALTLLGVKKETLYTYVSRGWIRSFPADNGRTRVFSRLDVERLRARSLARSGIGAVAGTVMRYGEPIISTRITEITPQGPRYRSRLAVELATKGSAFEAVAHWLWTGVWLSSHIGWNDTPRFQPATSSRQLGGRFDDFAKCMASTVLALGQQAAEGEPLHLSKALNSARQIIQVLVGLLGLLSPGRRYEPVRPGEPLALAVSRALGTRCADDDAVAAINALMVLCADYELTPASFAARVVASSGGDLHACLAAGLCAHSGMLTGRTCDKLTELMAGDSSCRSLGLRLEEARKSGITTYGFNPPLATHGDPRAFWMIERAALMNARTPSRATDNILRFLERLRDDFGLYPGLAAGLVALTAALGLPQNSAGALWGVARTAGQVAHVIEQREAGFILRPRAIFMPG